MYDYLIVGSGLFGSVFAYEMSKRGKKVLVLEKRSHIGGNCYTREDSGINVHEYGAHIFRTSHKDIWKYIQQFAEFNHFVNSPVARYHNKLYNLPFNMNTFNQIWGCVTPEEAVKKIESQRQEITGEPKNLEEKAISLVGRDVYEILIKEYTEKQWGRPCNELPASIIRRLPVRFIFDNNYFNDPYQGCPVGGYTQIIEKMLEHCDVRLNVDFLSDKEKYINMAEKVLYTGPIDALFEYQFGPLEYRSLRFVHKKYDNCDNLQGVAVVNYTDSTVPYTRTIEHKHFEFSKEKGTIVSEEYPSEWAPGGEPFYPINDEKNTERYKQYKKLADTMSNVIIGGRLGTYQYTDMQDTIIAALACVTTNLE